MWGWAERVGGQLEGWDLGIDELGDVKEREGQGWHRERGGGVCLIAWVVKGAEPREGSGERC